MSVVGAILLAAGRSQRMGTFKPLLPFGNKTVVETCLDNIYAGGVQDVVVVVGHRGDELRAALEKFPSVRFAVNEVVESEMDVSIKRGVEAIEFEVDAVVIALVDYPAVPPSVIRDQALAF